MRLTVTRLLTIPVPLPYTPVWQTWPVHLVGVGRITIG